MTEAKKYSGQIVFGLDIGTRSIVGTVGYKSGNEFRVIAQRTREHETRAMMDGQIHDIAKVGETIRQVREQLEEATGRKLTAVCIAAAGRVLQTVNSRVEWTLPYEREVTSEDIYALISMGVEKAYNDFIDANTMDIKFYCVGHSVVRYYLNEYPMGNLEGHKARSIGTDMIATFLPDEVVDGLYKAVELAGLTVANLTLEPIAAIQVAIPERFRMLNIALIDVGAGTSDISITQGGSIIAYGMIPVAGDALTEEIARYCLVDFNTAEQIKREAGETDTVTFQDIMFLPQTMSSSEILQVADKVVADMARQVSDKIKELNGDKAVSAVFVVGGGGKIPGYTRHLAQEMGIAEERVALRGEEVMQQIIFEEDVKKDSLLVTPIGICLNFYEQSNNFIFVTWNGQRVKIYDNNKLAVVDAAMQVQLPNDRLFPRRGRELHYTVDGTPRMVRGQLGEAAVITLNGEPADIHTPIHENDVIQVTESTMGKPAELTIGLLPEAKTSIAVIVNGQKVVLPKFASVNGALQSIYYDIQENDRIEMLNHYTVRQITEFMDVILESEMNLYVNNKLSDYDTAVYDNFSVNWSLPETDAESSHEERIRTEKQDGVKKQEDIQEPLVHSIQVVVNKQSVTLSGKTAYVFVDVFEKIAFDLSRPNGRSIITNINGRAAQYMEPIQSGDRIEIYWKEEHQ